MDIRQCREGDLARLEVHMPSPGRTRRHATRFERQRQGLSTYLVAWADDVPIGVGEVVWTGCAAPEVRRRYPDCPELNGLEVWPPRWRSRGVGTAIVRTAESLARERGHDRIGLGVDDDNPRAAVLYDRLGYEETGCRYLDRYHYVDEQGRRHDVADPARFLVKDLRPSRGRPVP
jgi:GNAT superfamily N-acetyltransferase